MREVTSQEKLWKSKFGDDYINRNRHELRLSHWNKILKKVSINKNFSFFRVWSKYRS